MNETTGVSTEELIELLRKPLDAQGFSKVCRELSAKTDDASLQALIRCLKSSDCYERRFALECIGKHQLYRFAINEIIASLNDQSPYVIRTALDIICEQKIAEAHTAILKFLKSSDFNTKKDAFRALYSIAAPEDFMVCSKLIIHESCHELQEIEANILFMYANEYNWQKVYEVLKDHEYIKLRMIACELLVKFGKNDQLACFFNDSDGHIRKFALQHQKNLL